MTSVDHDCWLKNATLNRKMTQGTDTCGTSITHGIMTALNPSAIFRATFTEWPRCNNQLESPPPTRQPSAAAANGIHATEPTPLMSKPRASSRYFGSQNM